MADEDRIARVARALCVADGHDPEAMVTVGSEMVDLGDGMTWQRDAAISAWTSYAGEARRIIAAMVALGLLQQHGDAIALQHESAKA